MRLCFCLQSVSLTQPAYNWISYLASCVFASVSGKETKRTREYCGREPAIAPKQFLATISCSWPILFFFFFFRSILPLVCYFFFRKFSAEKLFRRSDGSFIKLARTVCVVRELIEYWIHRTLKAKQGFVEIELS